MAKTAEERKAAIAKAREACEEAEEAAAAARGALWHAEQEERQATYAIRRAAENTARDAKVNPGLKEAALNLLRQCPGADRKVSEARHQRGCCPGGTPSFEGAHDVVITARRERAALTGALSALESQSPESVDKAKEEVAAERKGEAPPPEKLREQIAKELEEHP